MSLDDDQAISAPAVDGVRGQTGNVCYPRRHAGDQPIALDSRAHGRTYRPDVAPHSSIVPVEPERHAQAVRGSMPSETAHSRSRAPVHSSSERSTASTSSGKSITRSAPVRSGHRDPQ